MVFALAGMAFLGVNAKEVAATKTETSAPTTKTETLKIRVVDPYQIIGGLDQWKDETEKIQKEAESRSAKIRELQDTHAKKATELKTMSSAVKDSVKESKNEELLKLENEIRIKAQSLEQYGERAMQEAQMKILKEIENTLKEISKEQSINAVFAGGFLYADEWLNISNEVVERMNKAYAATKKKDDKKPAATK